MALALFFISRLDIFYNQTMYYISVSILILAFTGFAFIIERKSFIYED
jgi:hypothetical protein